MGICFLLKPINNHTTVYEEFTVKNTLQLKEMYERIGCNWIGIEGTVINGVDIVFDDEYLLKEEIPCVNIVASNLYGDMICGNVIVAKVDGEELVGFSGEMLDCMRGFMQKLAVGNGD